MWLLSWQRNSSLVLVSKYGLCCLVQHGFPGGYRRMSHHCTPLRCKMEMFQKSHVPALWDSVQILYRKLVYYHRSQEGRIWKPPSTLQNFLCSVFVSWLLALLKWLVKFEAVSDFVRLTWRKYQSECRFIWGHWESSEVLSSVELLSWCTWLWNLLSRAFTHRRSYAETVNLIN